MERRRGPKYLTGKRHKYVADDWNDEIGSPRQRSRPEGDPEHKKAGGPSGKPSSELDRIGNRTTAMRDHVVQRRQMKGQRRIEFGALPNKAKAGPNEVVRGIKQKAEHRRFDDEAAHPAREYRADVNNAPRIPNGR